MRTILIDPLSFALLLYKPHAGIDKKTNNFTLNNGNCLSSTLVCKSASSEATHFFLVSTDYLHYYQHLRIEVYKIIPFFPDNYYNIYRLMKNYNFSLPLFKNYRTLYMLTLKKL